MLTCRRCGTGSLIPTARLITLTGPGGAGKTRLALELARAIAAEGAIPCAVRRVGRDSEPGVRGAGDCRGARSVGRHGARLAEARAGRVRRSRPRCWCSTISSRCWTRRRWSRISSRRSRRSECWSPAAPRFACEESGSTPSDRSRWKWASTRCRPPIWHALPRCGYSWSGCGTCSLTFASRPRTAPTVTAICRRLDALPLALELAAPWIKVLTAEDLLRRLAHDVLLSTVGPRDLPERQQTMNATVAWSYQLLGAERTARVPPSRRAAGSVSDRGRRGGPCRS